MVSSPQKCLGIEDKVCGRFMPSKEHDPRRLCIARCGKSYTSDGRCEECHDWPDDCCSRVSKYLGKLLLQHKRKKERKTVFFFFLF